METNETKVSPTVPFVVCNGLELRFDNLSDKAMKVTLTDTSQEDRLGYGFHSWSILLEPQHVMALLKWLSASMTLPSNRMPPDLCRILKRVVDGHPITKDIRTALNRTIRCLEET